MMLILLSQNGMAQIDIQEVNHKGQSFKITKDIGFDKWGYYRNSKGSEANHWEIFLAAGKSYYWKKRKVVKNNITFYEWNEEDKIPIHWGAEVEEGHVVQYRLVEYQEGLVINRTAINIIICNKEKELFRELELYPKHDVLYLSNAEMYQAIDPAQLSASQ
jgi:hypothetical protein